MKTKMNVDTERAVKAAIANGWYLLSMGLGEGGWHAMNEHFWRHYILTSFDPDHGFTREIAALNDIAAICGFASLYNLSDMEYYEIQEKVTTYRQVSSSELFNEN